MFRLRNQAAKSSGSYVNSSAGTHSAEAGCVVHLTCSNRSVDVVVVDTARAAGVALGAPRTDAESTHVLCRHVDETTPDFMSRVLRRVERIQRNRRVRSLWYVGGSDAVDGRSPLPLLQSLAARLEGGGCLTVFGPRSHHEAVFEWVDSVVEQRPANVTVRAQLYPDAPSDGHETSHRGAGRAARSHGGAPASRRSSSARQAAWLTLDGASEPRARHI
jgi:hypothetical protein